MTEIPASRQPRNGGADQTATSRGLFRSWLRAALRGKPDTNWRETIEELIEDQSDDDTAVAAHERELLANILRLRDLKASDVMVPRADIVAVEIETPFDEVLKLLVDKALSRVPIYRGTLDDVVGMLHIKDVLAGLVAGTPVEFAGMVRDVLIVAPSMPVLDLLVEMRQAARHMALVVDEFGGIDGLVTIENLVEEVVGEIQDEHESVNVPELSQRPDGTYLADARLPIEEFEAEVGTILDDDEREDIETLGGLVFAIAGRIPGRGELLTHAAGFEFEVVDGDPRRIRRLRIRRIEPDAKPP